MAEEFNPSEAGRRIAREYLSKLGWAKEWRRTLNTQLYPAVEREVLEEKERHVDQMEEAAEAGLSTAYDQWRHDLSPQAREVLQGIYEILGKRSDLGFIAKRIVERIRATLTSP